MYRKFGPHVCCFIYSVNFSCMKYDFVFILNSVIGLTMKALVNRN